MRPEDQARLAVMQPTLDQAFGSPASADLAIVRVVALAGILGPLEPLAYGDVQWATPGLREAIERAREAVGELYEELESVIDDVAVLEPGTIEQQNFQDMPSRPPRTRGELAR